MKVISALFLFITVMTVSAATPSISVTARQRYPWNGLVDIDCVVSGVDSAIVHLEAIDVNTGSSLLINTLTYNGETFLNKSSQLANGTHRLIWDAEKDVATGFVSNNIRLNAKLLAPYMVIDLSGGASASQYSVSYLYGCPDESWTDEYKTSKLVLRRIPGGGECQVNSHSVTITKDYWMGVFEVTQDQWRNVTGFNPSWHTGEMRPVDFVSYDDVRGSYYGAAWPATNRVDDTSFIGKLRNKTGLTFDLPTESQWVYACQDGTSNLAELGRYKDNVSDGVGGYSSMHTTVGSYTPNTLGLYDMHGNVWERCLDWWEAGYLSEKTAESDRKGPESGTYRVLKGGSYNDSQSSCTISDRDRDLPSHYNATQGLRVACIDGL